MSMNILLYRADLLRQAKGRQSLRTVADRTGLAINTIRAAYDGSSTVTIKSLWHLAATLGVDWPDLFNIAGLDGIAEPETENPYLLTWIRTR